MTIEEFTEEVKEIFITEMRALAKEEVDAYFETEEAKRFVKSKYNVGIKDLESGKITDEIFREGYTSSLAHCLALMY